MTSRTPGTRSLLLCLTLLLPGLLAAQFYQLNENKIQYRRLDWQVLKGPRVDVYYYPAEAALAPVALAYAEETYDTLALKFGHTVTARVPLIIYASHADFEQTNVLPFTPPEGLLGVTDFLKRRVTLPFRGNFAEFRHTLRHEMVHVFQLSLLGDQYDRNPQSIESGLPLWWTEGLAEYWSAGEDARDEMILRDITLSGRLPAIQDLSYVVGGIVYPLGGRIHRWLADTYGDWRVASLYHELWRYESFEAAVEGVYGKSLAALNEEFQVAMRRAYYPVVEARASLPAVADLLATTAIKPTYAPDGQGGGEAVYATAVNGFVTVQARPLDVDKPVSVITSGRTAAFENFHAFDSRIDASRPGLLVLSSKFNDRDAILIYDREARRVVGRYQFPSLVSVLSPIWGPENRSIIFSGLGEDGISDLFQVTLPDGTLHRLTGDTYQDLDPSLSPDGRELVFASDRAAGGLDGAVNLFLMDLETHALRQLTAGPWVDETPRWTDDHRILFSSSRDGILNVFSVDTLGHGRRETSAWTGAYDAAPIPGRDAWLVGGFHDLSLSVYLYPIDSVARRDTFALADSLPAHSAWVWPETALAEAEIARSQPYRRRYTLDFAAGALAYSPGYGAGQGVTFLVSDILSDNLVFFNLSTYQAGRFKTVFENVSIFGLYLNQTRRLNWGVGGFRFKGNQYEGDFTVAYTENTVGTFGLLRYPLSRFARLEGQATIEHSDRVDLRLPVSVPRRVGWIASQYVSYVHDNALWTSIGPIDGHHLALTTGVASDFSNARFDSYSLVADGRQYLRLAGRSALALRGFGFYSAGDRPERTNIGGTLGIRGYPNYGYIIGSKAWLGSAEVRFPVLDYFTLGTILGGIRFPEIQGALFVDAGRAGFDDGLPHAVLGSYGLSWRWPLVPGFVLRLDWGRRFTDNQYRGYGLTPDQKRRGFLSLFFGYNY